jgi:uncharacterized Fe-S cluster-containing radical SAM superfamily protein
MSQQFLTRDNHLRNNSLVNDVKCGGKEEAVVRFAGCNFSCVHCFSSASSWPECWKQYKKMSEYSVKEAAAEINSVLSEYSYTWLRITGGEPFLNPKRAEDLSAVLGLIDENQGFGQNVIIQTNGLALANRGICQEIIARLAELPLQVLIEVSLKGTCAEEFELLTRLPGENYNKQLEAIKNLREIIGDEPNLSYRLIMGYGPNRIAPVLPAYVFVHPKRHFLLQMREQWDPNFTELYRNYLKESPSGHLGFSMACLVTDRWGIRALRNIEERKMLLRTSSLSDRVREEYQLQWESVHPYFVEMKPGVFYPLEFPHG